jgi:hypothetical protein
MSEAGIGLIDYWIEDCIVYLHRHTVMMEEMIACLLAEIRTDQELLKEKMLAKMKTNQEKVMVKFDAHHDKLMVIMKAGQENTEVMMYVCLEKTEAAMKSFRALTKRHGDRRRALGRRQKAKKRTQGNGGSPNKMATTGSGMTCRAGVAWPKGRGHKGPMVKQRQRKTQTGDNVVQGALKGQTFGKRRRAQPECNNGTKNKGLRELLCLGSKGNVNETFKETLGLEIAKRIAGSPIRIRKMSAWTLWRSRPPLKRKKRPTTD